MKDFDALLVDESLYATANGYIGVRGNFEEGYPEHALTYHGTYLNGFFDTHHIKYSESAYGFPTVGETIVNVLDGQRLEIEIDGEKFSMFEGKVLDFKRVLDIKTGMSIRTIHWCSNRGHELKLTFKRMTSFVTQELFVIHVNLESINFEGKIKITSLLDGQVKRVADTDDPRVATEHIQPMDMTTCEVQGQKMILGACTNHSKVDMQLICCHSHEGHIENKSNHLVYTTEQMMESGKSFEFTKYMIYTDGHKHADVKEEGALLLETAFNKGIATLFEEQKEFLDHFWHQSDIEIIGDDELTYAIAYSQYQLLAAAGRDGVSQVAAKGLTGAGYEGHYFWDTEIYVIPFFTLTNPKLAKEILRYRHNILDASKERSLQLGHNSGAKIPWRTISGRECSSYFPAGTAQYHINADVAYAYIQYFIITKDKEMMKEFGYDLLVETAKLWLEVGHYKDGEFCIDGVTGPDEYTAIVNNNYYTNAMAKYHLEWTAKLYDEFHGYAAIDEETKAAMADAADNMRLPFDETLGIHMQDDSFLTKKVWDFENTPKEKYPLLLNYHPLKIYRHQVLKQADTVLAHFLLDDVSDEIIEKSYHYYENITTHDSSLSPCVYGMMANRINAPDKAYEFLMKTVYLDLKNLHQNTKDGMHIANAGGTFMSIAFGFGGLRIKENGVHLKPVKPKEWTGYSFKFKIGEALIKVTVTDQIVVEATEPVTLMIHDKTYTIDGRLEVSYERD